MLHQLHRKQLLHAPMEQVWSFMSDPANLARITPPDLGFETINGSGAEPMFAGQLIEYYIRPLLGIRLHWVTEITHVQEHRFFVDEQRSGPYAFWHHKHFFRPQGNEVEMTDLVHYRLPLGPLGRMAHHLFVKKQLEAIFDYRREVLGTLFKSGS